MDAAYPELHAGKVTIVSRSGKAWSKRVDYSKGMPENPMSEEDIDEKFRSQGSAAVDHEAASSLLEMLRGAFSLSDAGAIGERLGATVLLPH